MTDNDRKTTTSSGNTTTSEVDVVVENKPKYSKSSRNFLITVQESNFNKIDEIIGYLTHFKTFNYILVCDHDGPKTPHKHIYVQYTNAHKIDRRYTYDSHDDACLGSAQQNIAYCKGLDDKHIKSHVKCSVYYEQGTPMIRGGAKIKDIKKMSIDDLNELPIQYFRLVNDEKTLRANDIEIKNFHKDILVFWLWGPSGGGKTEYGKYIAQMYGYDTINETKFVNNYYLGLGNNHKECALIYDDWRESDMKPHELINLIDYNKHPMNIKNGVVINEYNLIIITSKQNPYDIYENYRRLHKEETAKQWIRRLEPNIFYIDGNDEINESEF